MLLALGGSLRLLRSALARLDDVELEAALAGYGCCQILGVYYIIIPGAVQYRTVFTSA